jgi:glyoxylase I family protein
MIKTRGIAHFTIPVRDTARAEAFYRDVLGCEVIQRVPRPAMVFLKTGEDFVVLTESKGPIGSPPEDCHHVHHAFVVDEAGYDDQLAYLRSKGVEILFEEDRHEGIFQGRQTYFRDPDGNVLEIVGLRNRVKG